MERSRSVCLVTGASRGLGKAISEGLARRGATVIMVCRDPARGEAAKEDVRKVTGSDTVELLLGDLSDPTSVRDLAASVARRHERLHVLVNNAAVYTRHRQTTRDGLELMFSTNFLGPFLLTNLLLPALKRGAPSRIITVAAPTTSKIDFGDPQGSRKFGSLHAFGASKMGDLLFTYELARRLEGTGVTANVVHPGLMISDLMREASAPLRWLTRAGSKPPEVAAAAVVHLALSPEVATQTGRFFKGKTLSESAPYSRDPAVQRQMWDLGTKLTGPP